MLQCLLGHNLTVESTAVTLAHLLIDDTAGGICYVHLSTYKGFTAALQHCQVSSVFIPAAFLAILLSA